MTESAKTTETPVHQDDPATTTPPEVLPHTGEPTADTPVVDEPHVTQTVATPRKTSGVAAGAVALVGAALGLVSLTGGGVSDMERERESVVGQISAGTGGGGDQVAAVYSGPWHAAALVNGAFALLAIVVAGIAFVLSRTAPGWVRAAALAGVGIGVIGLLVSAGMYLDLFGSAPTMPQTPQMPGAGG